MGTTQPVKPGFKKLAIADAMQAMGILPILILIVIVFSFVAPNFMTEANMMNITRQASINIVLAAGMTFVILTGGIDLSVGSILGVTAVIGLVTSLNPALAEFAVPLALLAGLGMGVFNGLLVAYAGLPPFIVTLGTYTALRGAAYLVADGTTVINSKISFSWIGNGYLGSIPWLVIIAFAVIAVCWFILRRTTLGTHIYAVGELASCTFNRYQSLFSLNLRLRCQRIIIWLRRRNECISFV